MSTYTHEEICKGCVFANWIDDFLFWDNRERFACCDEFKEKLVDHLSGKCESKEQSDDT